MPNIYDQHDAAFRHVSASVIARDGKRVATIAFKFPRDGAGRLYAYVHWLGEPMVRGYAGGYGYDKRSAACAYAARKLTCPPASWRSHDGIGATIHHEDPAVLHNWRAFRDALTPDDGHEWDSRLRKAGFDVWQAV